MKRVFLSIAMAMFTLCVNAQKDCSPEVLDCLDKALHLSDLQSARSDMKRKTADCRDNAEALLICYKQIRYIDIRIAELAFELRESMLYVPKNEQACDEMEFSRKILEKENI